MSFTLFGLPVIVNPACENVQRVTVSAEFARLQSPELVASTNAWMREFFGVHDVVYMVTDHQRSRKLILMGPRAYAQLPVERAAT